MIHVCNRNSSKLRTQIASQVMEPSPPTISNYGRSLQLLSGTRPRMFFCSENHFPTKPSRFRPFFHPYLTSPTGSFAIPKTLNRAMLSGTTHVRACANVFAALTLFRYTGALPPDTCFASLVHLLIYTGLTVCSYLCIRQPCTIAPIQLKYDPYMTIV